MTDITLCHPKLQNLAQQLIKTCQKQNLTIKITETYRTAAEQDALYAQGRTKPGKIITNAPGSTYSSMHQWGIAFDICRNDGKGAYNEAGGFFDQVGAIGQQLGLEWGGGWKSIVDKPHFQLPDWGSTPEQLKKQYGNAESFMKTWDLQKEGWIQDGTGWWYRHKDGTYTQNDWEQIDGKWYWFNGSGYAIVNDWKTGKDGKWYYLGSDRAMVAATVLDIGKEVFAFDETGAMITDPGKLKINERGAVSI